MSKQTAAQLQQGPEGVTYQSYRLLGYNNLGQITEEMWPYGEAWTVNPDEVSAPVQLFCYQYNEQGQLARKTFDYRGSCRGDFVEYTYDGNTLVEGVWSLDQDQRAGIHQYKFDGKKSLLETSDFFLFGENLPSIRIFPPAWALGASGNLIHININDDVYGDPEYPPYLEPYSRSYSYAYNKEGYPVSMTDDHTGQVTTFTYKRKK